MFTIDQQSQGDNFGRHYYVASDSSIGQEFVPSAASLNTVELDLVPLSSGPVVGWVRIHLDTISGPLLGGSRMTPIRPLAPYAYWVSGFPRNPTRFRFTTAVGLQPGQRHVIEMVPFGGAVVTYSLFAQVGESYPRGRIIVNGMPVEVLSASGRTMSLWFQEGFDDAPESGDRPFERVDAIVMHLLLGVAVGAGGFGLLPGGQLVPIGPHVERTLNPATRQALTGLALHEMASIVDDEGVRQTVEQAGLGLVRKALDRLAGL